MRTLPLTSNLFARGHMTIDERTSTITATIVMMPQLSRLSLAAMMKDGGGRAKMIVVSANFKVELPLA